MSGQPRRPLFFEGQVLTGADLDQTVDHARNAHALHERALHTWGIAEGLDLSHEPQTHTSGATFQRVTVTSGAAIDGAGRQIVVPEPVPLSETAFDQLNGTTVTAANRDTPFPVFLVARDDPAPPDAGVGTRCGTTGQSSRIVEGYEVSFGRAGDELGLDDQRPPAADQGPGEVTTPWRVLLGFVQWNPDIGKFSAVLSEANGVARRYAGAKADEVAARGGRVEVRSQVVPRKGTAALVVDEQDGGRLSFGLHDGAGAINHLLTVNGKGDLTAVGKLSGSLTGGSALVQSGLASDGVILPLPPGIEQEQVDAGRVTIHISVTLHVPPSPPPQPGFAYFPVTLEVDGDRRVHCVVGWFDPAGGPVDQRPGTCDYLVVAAVPATNGGS